MPPAVPFPDDVTLGILCPITLDVMRDPVFAADGETYERAAIVSHFASLKEAGKPIYSPTVGFVCRQGQRPGSILHAPASECQCPVPWCAHGLTVLFVLRMMQNSTSLAEFRETFKPYVK